ncbi:unnamed protein product, partial [Discosporangium mesarthrocarpum]
DICPGQQSSPSGILGAANRSPVVAPAAGGGMRRHVLQGGLTPLPEHASMDKIGAGAQAQTRAQGGGGTSQQNGNVDLLGMGSVGEKRQLWGAREGASVPWSSLRPLALHCAEQWVGRLRPECLEIKSPSRVSSGTFYPHLQSPVGMASRLLRLHQCSSAPTMESAVVVANFSQTPFPVTPHSGKDGEAGVGVGAGAAWGPAMQGRGGGGAGVRFGGGEEQEWVAVGGSWKEEENVCGYWRFGEGGGRVPLGEAEEVLLSDLSKFGSMAVCRGPGVRFEETTSPVDPGEKGKVAEAMDVCFPEDEPTRPTAEGNSRDAAPPPHAQPGPYTRGIFVGARRGSSVDIGVFHDQQRRSVATVEMWVKAGSSSKEVKERKNQLYAYTTGAAIGGSGNGTSESSAALGAGGAPFHVLACRLSARGGEHVWSLVVENNGQMALIPGPRGRSDLGPGYVAPTGEQEEGRKWEGWGDSKIKALKEAVSTEAGVFPSGRWTHVAVTLDTSKDESSAEVKLFVDTRQRGQGTCRFNKVNQLGLAESWMVLGADLRGWRMTEARLWAMLRDEAALQDWKDNSLSLAEIKKTRLVIRAVGRSSPSSLHQASPTLSAGSGVEPSVSPATLGRFEPLLAPPPATPSSTRSMGGIPPPKSFSRSASTAGGAGGTGKAVTRDPRKLRRLSSATGPSPSPATRDPRKAVLATGNRRSTVLSARLPRLPTADFSARLAISPPTSSSAPSPGSSLPVQTRDPRKAALTASRRSAVMSGTPSSRSTRLSTGNLLSPPPPSPRDAATSPNPGTAEAVDQRKTMAKGGNRRSITSDTRSPNLSGTTSPSFELPPPSPQTPTPAPAVAAAAAASTPAPVLQEWAVFDSPGSQLTAQALGTVLSSTGEDMLEAATESMRPSAEVGTGVALPGGGAEAREKRSEILAGSRKQTLQEGEKEEGAREEGGLGLTPAMVKEFDAVNVAVEEETQATGDQGEDDQTGGSFIDSQNPPVGEDKKSLFEKGNQPEPEGGEGAVTGLKNGQGDAADSIPWRTDMRSSKESGLDPPGDLLELSKAQANNMVAVVEPASNIGRAGERVDKVMEEKKFQVGSSVVKAASERQMEPSSLTGGEQLVYEQESTALEATKVDISSAAAPAKTGEIEGAEATNGMAFRTAGSTVERELQGLDETASPEKQGPVGMGWHGPGISINSAIVMQLTGTGLGLTSLEVANALLHGSLLGSNPRYVYALGGSMVGTEGGGQEGTASTAGAQPAVSVVDLWEGGQIFRYPVLCTSAAISPRRDQQIMAFSNPGGLKVYNMTLRSLLREQRTQSKLCFLVWTSEDDLAIMTEQAVFHWHIGRAEIASKAFDRCHTLLASCPPGAYPNTYTTSACGRWGMLTLIGRDVCSSCRSTSAGDENTCSCKASLTVDLHDFRGDNGTRGFHALGAALLDVDAPIAQPRVPGGAKRRSMLALVRPASFRMGEGSAEHELLLLDPSGPLNGGTGGVEEQEGRRASCILPETVQGSGASWLLDPALQSTGLLLPAYQVIQQ